MLIRNFNEEEKGIESCSFVILLENKNKSKKNKRKLFSKILSSNKSYDNIIISFKSFNILLNEFDEKIEKKINNYKFNNSK